MKRYRTISKHNSVQHKLFPDLYESITDNFLGKNFEYYCQCLDNAYWMDPEIKNDMKLYESFYYFKYPNKRYSFSPHTPEFEKQLLYEGLLFSVEADSAIHKLKNVIKNFYNKQAKTSNIQLSITYDNSGLIYVQWPYINSIDELIEIITPTLNNLGYFIAKNTIELHKFFGTKFNSLIIEPKFNIEKTNIVYKTRILYHIAPERLKHKILSYGLEPRSKSKQAYHPERIYCLLPETINQIIEPLTLELLQTDKFPDYLAKLGQTNKMCLFKIDLNNHPHQISFFEDPACKEYGVYTLENISPDCIEYLGEIAI